MEDAMCWEMDYEFFIEQEKAKKAEKTQEQRSGVIKNLLNEASKSAENAEVAPTPVKEIVPAK
jgi:hypothetical protein